MEDTDRLRCPRCGGSALAPGVRRHCEHCRWYVCKCCSGNEGRPVTWDSGHGPVVRFLADEAELLPPSSDRRGDA